MYKRDYDREEKYAQRAYERETMWNCAFIVTVHGAEILPNVRLEQT